MNEPKAGFNSSELSNQRIDYVTSAAKAALGTVPFAGSLLAEIAGNVIPNQRIDRVVKFASALEQRIAELESGFVRSQVTNENFTDLVEEGLRQAARSLSDDRREYIASLIANSLKSDEINFAESKHLLRILGELNDVEVIWLRFYHVGVLNGDHEFREKHREVLNPVVAHLSSPASHHEKAALQSSYKDHMAELGLLRRTYEIETSAFGTKLKTRGYEINSLGRLLLKEIGVL